jgi:Ankyrin repeats (3 copies)/Ankyrin repeats (many copies)
MPSSIRKALNELPTTLDDTYERALEGIPKEKSQHAHHLFQCLVGAIRPLRAEELAEIFAIDFDRDAMSNFMDGWRPENAEEAVLSTCSTLISVVEDKGSKIVQFSHFSVKEFLTSDRLLTSKVGDIRHYHVSLDAAHTILVRACLAVLMQLDKNVDHKHLETFPLALYVAKHWVNHAQYDEVASRVQDTMEELFNPSKPYLAAWLGTRIVTGGLYVVDLAEHLSRPKAAALYHAAEYGFGGVVDHLIMMHAADVNEESSLGAALHAASRYGHAEVVYLLLQRNADVNIRSTYYVKWTPLHFASANGHAKVVPLLLEHGADINAQSTSDSTPLKFASENGHLEVVQLLLACGADVHIRDTSGESPFNWATLNGHVAVGQLLLEHGAETN